MCSVFLDILFYEKEVSFPYFFFLKILLGMPPPTAPEFLIMICLSVKVSLQVIFFSRGAFGATILKFLSN